MVGLGGVGVMPVSSTSAAFRASAMRKIEPTLTGYPTLWQTMASSVGDGGGGSVRRNRFNGVPRSCFIPGRGYPPLLASYTGSNARQTSAISSTTPVPAPMAFSPDIWRPR